MEAARIPWRPLGRILVEQGLLTSEELETALEQQERTGKRLGETIVECGFVSGPELSTALAVQYGIELTTETGFGTGLRGQIQRRYETERRGVRPVLAEGSPLDDDPESRTEPEADELDPAPPEAGLLVQLEEQWAKLAAAEALIAEYEQELAAVAARHDRRRDQAVRLARRARARPERPESETHELEHLHDLSEHLREQAERLTGDLRARDEEIGRLRHESGHAHDRLNEAEASLREQAHEAGWLRAQIEQLGGDVRSREQELDRLRTEHSHDRDRLAGAEHALAERDRELDELRTALEQARHVIAAGEAEVAERDRRSEGFEADLERLVRERAGAEAALAVAEESLRERDQRLDHQTEHLAGELDRVQAELEHRVAEARGREEEIEGLRRELERAHAEQDARRRQRSQAARFATRLRRLRQVDEEQLAQIEQLVANVRGCDDEIGRLRYENERIGSELLAKHGRARAQTRRFLERLRRRERELAELAAERDGPVTTPEIAGHLVFVQLADRYELVERTGPPPPRNSPLELPELDARFVVAGTRRSPRPGDATPCVVAEAAFASERL